MQFSKVFFFLLLSVFATLAFGHHELHDNHDHGTSHMAIEHKHGGKFQYHVKHGKHGSHHGSSHPHGYGGYGDNH